MPTLITDADTGSGSDGVTKIGITTSDTATGTDAISGRQIGLTDTSTGVDALVSVKPAFGVITILKAASIPTASAPTIQS